MQILTSKLLSTKLGAIIGTWVRMDTNTTRECDLIHAVEERILELNFLAGTNLNTSCEVLCTCTTKLAIKFGKISQGDWVGTPKKRFETLSLDVQ